MAFYNGTKMFTNKTTHRPRIPWPLRKKKWAPTGPDNIFAHSLLEKTTQREERGGGGLGGLSQLQIGLKLDQHQQRRIGKKTGRERKVSEDALQKGNKYLKMLV